MIRAQESDQSSEATTVALTSEEPSNGPSATDGSVTSSSPAPTPTTEASTTTPTEASSETSAKAGQSSGPAVAAPINPKNITVSALTYCPNDLLVLTGGSGPEGLLDGDPASGWRCDDRKDYREGNINTVSTEGQVLQFQFDRSYELTSLEIIEGAAKDSFRWCENGRLHRVQWDFKDGTAPLVMEFPDRPDYPTQDSLYLDFPLEPARTTNVVTMSVISIFPARQDCKVGSETARPWEYGFTARPSEVRFVGRTAS